jgi:uncharacterized membrane protein
MAKCVAVVCYLTVVGWLIAFVIYGNNKSSLSSFHLRQSLGLIVTGCLLSFIPLIGWLLNLGVIVGWFYGLYYAVKGMESAVPILGQFYQQHLDFIR